jgi:hypothetical protein
MPEQLKFPVNNSCSPSCRSEQNILIEKQRKEEEEKKR